MSYCGLLLISMLVWLLLTVLHTHITACLDHTAVVNVLSTHTIYCYISISKKEIFTVHKPVGNNALWT